MESLDILNNVTSFEATGGALENFVHTSDQTEEISLDNDIKSTKDELYDGTNINDSEDNFVDVIPIESSKVQDNCDVTSTENSEDNLVDITPTENSEDNLVDITPTENAEFQDNFDVTPKENSGDNLVNITPIENAEVLSVQNSHTDHDSITSEMENKNTSANEESFCEFMQTSETERNEEELLPSDSPMSPSSLGSVTPDPEMFESTSDVCSNENEKLSRASRKNFSLPYFHLPKPDLDEYLVQTEELLSGNKKDSLSSNKSVGEKYSASKRRSVLDEFLEKFPVEKDELHIINPPCNDKLTRTSICQEYSKVISCIGQLDESKSPGIKRIALREFLQKKINEKKSAAFNRSKKITNLDENEEIDENGNIEFDVQEEEEQLKSGNESSDEDLEEPTVAFSFEGDGKNVHNFENDERLSLSDESDEDIVTVKRKPKRLQILEEDSDDESCAAVDLNCETEEKSIENNEESFHSMNDREKFPETDFCDEVDEKRIEKNEKSFNSENGSLSNGPSADTQINMGFVDIPSYQPVVNLHTNLDESSHDSLSSEMYKKENFKGPLNFAESNLSENNSPVPLSMDDPPLMLSGNAPLMDDIFLSQDLAAVCSGAFKMKEGNNNTLLSKEEEHLESENEMKSINQDKFLEEPDFNSDKDSQAEDEEKINDFLDLEAELSGEDDGEDDAESDGEGIGDLIAADHEVPSDAQVREEIVDLHLKHLIDDDEEILREYKEKFLDDGELHGDGRTRRFAWKNNAIDMDDLKNGMSSESDEEGPSDSWSSMNQEKAKWLEENKEKELTDNLNSSYKNLLKVKIIGKPEFSQSPRQDSSRRLSCKRSRGSFLHLDNSSASQVLKKLKASEDACGGSRTTKHFVFRNDGPEEPSRVSKQVATTSATEDATFAMHGSDNQSIFSKI